MGKNAERKARAEAKREAATQDMWDAYYNEGFRALEAHEEDAEQKGRDAAVALMAQRITDTPQDRSLLMSAWYRFTERMGDDEERQSRLRARTAAIDAIGNILLAIDAKTA